MNKSNIKRKIVAGGLAAVIAVASGITVDKTLNKKVKDDDIAKNKTDGIEMFDEIEYQDNSYILGGYVGHYDYIKNNDNDPTNNDYYEKYNNYFDKKEYNSGYIEGYQQEGMFKGMDEEYLLYNADIMAITFDLIAKDLVTAKSSSAGTKFYTQNYKETALEIKHQVKEIQNTYGYESYDDQEYSGTEKSR